VEGNGRAEDGGTVGDSDAMRHSGAARDEAARGRARSIASDWSALFLLLLYSMRFRRLLLSKSNGPEERSDMCSRRTSER
jgi:hypothetical protein